MSDRIPTLKIVKETTFVNPSAEHVDFYLCGNIGDASDYIEWFQKLRGARDTDVIRIHINACGGDMYTMVQLVDAIKCSKSRVIAYAEGQVFSAATMVFLCCDGFYISPWSSFMFHTYSTGIFGKSSEITANLEFKQKYTKTLFDDMYEHILSAEEIENLYTGSDIWITASEMSLRLTARNKIRNAEHEEAIKPVKKPAKMKPRAKTTKR